jgi:hypothetical protein
MKPEEAHEQMRPIVLFTEPPTEEGMRKAGQLTMPAPRPREFAPWGQFWR